MNLAGIAFDFDGVLLDSEVGKARAHVDAARAFGGTVTEDDYGRVLGQSAETVASYMIQRAGLDCSVTLYLQRFRASFSKEARNARLFPGTLDLLQYLRRAGVRIGIATSTERADLDALVVRLGMAAWVDVTVAAGEVLRPKPAPDGYLRVVSELGVDPNSIVAVEDTEVGMRAAQADGLPTVALRHALNRHMQFAEADAVADSFLPVAHFIAVLRDTLRRTRGACP